MQSEPETNDAPNPTPEPAPVEQKPKVSRSERREKAAKDALRTFLRDLHLDRFGAVQTKADKIDLTLHLKADPANDWGLEFKPSLGEQLLSQVEDAQAGWNVFKQGRTYCFRCESPDCEHAAPPDPLKVFKGYEPNGLPIWCDLTQALIEAKDERVDRLFGNPPGVVSVVQYGHDLKARQLSSFGRSSKTYSILGQVITGYFPLPAKEGGGLDKTSRLAISFQAVEARGDHGTVKIKLNALARLPDGLDLSDLLASGWQPGLFRARQTAMRAMENLEQQAAGARTRGDTEEISQAMRQVPVILRRLSESLERTDRQVVRRTRHVEERRHQQRPVHKALDDALSASLETSFYDEKAGTAVFCGPQGRAHVFNPNGQHVTSFTLRPAAIDFRLRTRRWRMMKPEESEELKQRIKDFIPRKPDSPGVIS